MKPKFSPSEEYQNAVTAIMQRQQPAAFIGALKAMAERMDTSSMLANLNIPVVVIHGDADSLVAVDRAREMKAALRSAHFVELKGVGHLPMMEAVKETAEALKHLA